MLDGIHAEVQLLMGQNEELVSDNSALLKQVKLLENRIHTMYDETEMQERRDEIESLQEKATQLQSEINRLAICGVLYDQTLAEAKAICKQSYAAKLGLDYNEVDELERNPEYVRHAKDINAMTELSAIYTLADVNFRSAHQPIQRVVRTPKPKQRKPAMSGGNNL